jgi:hypothetical protein
MKSLIFKSKSSKTNFELKILKLRTTWNELILSKNKRDTFFQQQFQIQYDDKFLKFLLFKSIEIIESINAHLPMTKIEEVYFQFL